MTMVQQRLWSKPIRTETNSVWPGSTARPFTTSYRTNECVPSIFPPLIRFFKLPTPSTLTSIYFFFFFYTRSSWSIWFPLLPPLPSFPLSIPPPLLLCAEVIVDAKGRGPWGPYQPITSVGVSGDEMERSRPAGGLDGSFNAERGVCKQTVADRVYACHNRSGLWSIFPLPFFPLRSPFLSPLRLHSHTWVPTFLFTFPPKRPYFLNQTSFVHYII